MGIELESVIVRMRQGQEAEVIFTVMPTGTDTVPSGKANVPQHLINNLKRAAGFRPKLWRGDPAYMTTPATGGFSNRNGISGRTEYVPNALAQGRAACGESLGAGGSAANDKEKANA